MTLTGSIARLLLILMSAAPFCEPASAEDERPGRGADEFLAAWARGVASFDLFTKLHARYPRSPHKRESEEFEVAVKCLGLRKECGEDRATRLTGDLLKLYSAEDAEEEMRRRILFVLGRIRSPQAVRLLCEVAKSADGDRRERAIESLAFYGKVPAGDSFMVFGGRFREVVFPPAPSRAATDALLELLRKLRGAGPRAGVAPERSEQVRRDRFLACGVLRSLRSHRGARVAGVALDMLRGGDGDGAGRLLREVGDLIARNLDHLDREQIVALLDDERPAVRRTAAYALGWSASAWAVPPLIRRLGDESDEVRQQVNTALLRLSGSRPDPLRGVEARTPEAWIATLGRDGERLDEEKAIRHADLKPGIYRIGS